MLQSLPRESIRTWGAVNWSNKGLWERDRVEDENKFRLLHMLIT